MDLQILGMGEHETHIMPLPRKDRADYLVAWMSGYWSCWEEPKSIGRTRQCNTGPMRYDEYDGLVDQLSASENDDYLWNKSPYFCISMICTYHTYNRFLFHHGPLKKWVDGS